MTQTNSRGMEDRAGPGVVEMSLEEYGELMLPGLLKLQEELHREFLALSSPDVVRPSIIPPTEKDAG